MLAYLLLLSISLFLFKSLDDLVLTSEALFKALKYFGKLQNWVCLLLIPQLHKTCNSTDTPGTWRNPSHATRFGLTIPPDYCSLYWCILLYFCLPIYLAAWASTWPVLETIWTVNRCRFIFFLALIIHTHFRLYLYKENRNRNSCAQTLKGTTQTRTWQMPCSDKLLPILTGCPEALKSACSM